MKDFLDTELKQGDTIFTSWGGNRHAVGQIIGFKGKTMVIVSNIEKASWSQLKKSSELHLSSKNIIKIR